jgi:AcrR family transcriptional regulator
MKTDREVHRVASRATRARKPTRAEKAALTRRALLRAAEEVVGEVGYADAMVTMITARAGLAAGTFYNYFESRQDLFDQLLPALGQDLLDFVKVRAESAENEAEREELRLRAFFEFMTRRPEFYRILYEAEVFAPAAFGRHMETVTGGYTRALRRAQQAGEIEGFADGDMEIVACMLLGVRNYLAMRYARSGGRTFMPPEGAVAAYMQLITQGLVGPSTGRRRQRRTATASSGA